MAPEGLGVLGLGSAFRVRGLDKKKTPTTKLRRHHVILPASNMKTGFLSLKQPKPSPKKALNLQPKGHLAETPHYGGIDNRTS